MSPKYVFVFDPKTNDPKVIELLAAFAHLTPKSAPATQPQTAKKVEGKPLGSGRSFRSVQAQLEGMGIYISGAYVRHDGKLVFQVGEVTVRLLVVLVQHSQHIVMHHALRRIL